MLQDHSRNRTPMPAAQPTAGAAPPEPEPARAEAGIARMLSASPARAPIPTEQDLARMVVDYFGDGPMDEFLDGDMALRDCARAILAASPTETEPASAEAGIARMLSAPPHGDQPPADFIEACDWAVQHSAWINGNGRDDEWDDAHFERECDKSDAVWKRAVETQAHDTAMLAAKSRLLLDNLEDHFSSSPESEPDARDRMTMSILRDAVAMGRTPAPVPASQAAHPADPVLAAIATYRVAEAAMDALSDRIEGRCPSADEFAEENRLSAEQCRLRNAALATVPTTPAGRAALAQFVRDEIAASGTIEGGPPDDDHPIWRDGLRALLAAQEAEIRPHTAPHPDTELLAKGPAIRLMTERRDELYPAVRDTEAAAFRVQAGQQAASTTSTGTGTERGSDA